MPSTEELEIAQAALEDVVADAEALIESLDEIAEAAWSDSTHQRFAGWRVPVEALRNDAHRLARQIVSRRDKGGSDGER